MKAAAAVSAAVSASVSAVAPAMPVDGEPLILRSAGLQGAALSLCGRLAQVRHQARIARSSSGSAHSSSTLP
jgi:hypothetical protein